MSTNKSRQRKSAVLRLASANRIGYGLAAAFAEQEAGAASPVLRRFIRVGDRGVHYLRAGEGPPVVLLHSALLSARFGLPLIHRLAGDHTIFAFDNPGFGDSDPLTNRNLSIANAADALASTLAALKMPRCPVYGSHTGGAIAAELARRHPKRVAALIIDGVNIFGPADTKFLGSDLYRPIVTARDDGSHLFADWMKSRDTMMWFPWSVRGARNRLPWAFPPPEILHDGFLDRLRAGNGYRTLYGAVFKHDMRAAVKALTLPATFMAHEHDILYPHLDRLPKLKSNQHIGRYPPDAVAYMEQTARVIRSYRVQTPASVDLPFRPTPGVINRRYVDLEGGQILVRSAGETRRGRPLLLLHDGRASSRAFEPLMRDLSRSRSVYALDLPDNGASDSLAVSQPQIGDYADAVADTVAALNLGPCDIYAMGAGAVVALDLLARPEFSKTHAVLESPDFYAADCAHRLAPDWVPPLTPEWDGGHLNRLWLMLRDEYAFWPWFDKSAAAACAVDAPSDWQEMHARVVDILRSLPTYHRLTQAALDYDWATALRRVGKGAVKLATTADDPRRRHTLAAAQRASLREPFVLSSPTKKKAREILSLLGK